jgi:restriction system protein
VHSSDDCVHGVARLLNLSPADMLEKVKSGSRSKVTDRTQWAKTYLEWAGLVTTVKRGYYAITNEGVSLLQMNPTVVDKAFLMANYPSFVKNSTARRTGSENKDADKKSSLIMTDNVKSSLTDKDKMLDFLRSLSPANMAKVLVRVLQLNGYYCKESSFRVLNDSIRAKIYLDKLEIVPAYLYMSLGESKVSRIQMGNLIQLMYDDSCSYSVILTLSGFEEEAFRFNAPAVNIVKIDGNQLATLIIDSGMCTDSKTIVEFHPENILL